MHLTQRFSIPRARTVAQLAAVLLPLIAAATAGVVTLRSQPAEAHLGLTEPTIISITQVPPKNAFGWNNTAIDVEVCAHSDDTDITKIAAESRGHFPTEHDLGVVLHDTDCSDFSYPFQKDIIEQYHADEFPSVDGPDKEYPIRIDMTPPVVVFKPYLLSQVQGLDTMPGGIPAGPPIALFFGVWQNQRAVVFIMCMDVADWDTGVMSGIGTNTYPSRINFPRDGNFVFNPPGECRDKAGNLATEPVVDNVMIDTRQPTCGVAFNQKAKHDVARLIRTTVSGTDATSGVFSREVTAISSMVGVGAAPGPAAPGTLDATYTGASGRSWTLTGKVTDNAGNFRICTKKLVSIR